MDRWGLFTTQVYALKSGAWLCGQKFTQDFRFEIHLFLENVYKVNVVYFLEHKVFDFI